MINLFCGNYTMIRLHHNMKYLSCSELPYFLFLETHFIYKLCWNYNRFALLHKSFLCSITLYVMSSVCNTKLFDIYYMDLSSVSFQLLQQSPLNALTFGTTCATFSNQCIRCIWILFTIVMFESILCSS